MTQEMESPDGAVDELLSQPCLRHNHIDLRNVPNELIDSTFGEFMNYRSFAFLIVALLVGSTAHAQNPILDLRGTTYSQKMVFAVYDLRGPASVEAIETAVVEAIRLYARDASIRNGIPPMPLPDYPNQMRIVEQPGGGPRSDCQGYLFSVSGLDTSMAQYGEVTYHRGCLFPYAGGYRVNYLAIYKQQSGLGAKNPNVLAAMLGRVMAKAVGMGDSSGFVVKILDRMEEGFKNANLDFRLVQLHPQDMAGRTLVKDDLIPPIPVATTAPAQAVPASPATPQAPTQGAESAPATLTPIESIAAPKAQTQGTPAVSNEQLQKMLLIQQMREASMRQIAAMNPDLVEPQTPKAMTAVEARKELTAMGLQYFSQEQFLAAVKRGDMLAVERFVTGGGVDINTGDGDKSAAVIAETAGHQNIAVFLRGKGAR